jgi:hypothetical protein
VSRKGCDDGIRTRPIVALCDLLRSFWSSTFNGTRVTPVSLIELFGTREESPGSQKLPGVSFGVGD